MTAIVINAIQLAALIVFAILAILYRYSHPDLAYVQTATSIIIPHNFTNLLFQSTIAILLLVGFESVTSLGSEALQPKKDIKRAILLSLVIQGVFAYLFEYFAAIYFVGPQLTGTDSTGAAVSGWAAAAASGAPIGDMVRVMGDALLGGSGFPLVIIFAATVVLALIGTTLACLNTGVRITYSMGKDKEMPTLLGILHGKYDTPHYGIWILVAISAAFGAYGVLNVDNLTQITLASNTGTFLLYGLTNLICLWAFFHRPDASFLKHKLVPFVGFLANILMLGAIVWIGMSAGGNTAMDAVIAISVVIVWLVIGGAWFIHNTKKEGHTVTTGHLTQATGLEIDNS